MDSGGRISPPLSSGPSAHETPAGHRRLTRHVSSQLALCTHISLRLLSCSRSDQLTRDEAAARLCSKGGPSSGTLAKLVPPPSSRTTASLAVASGTQRTSTVIERARDADAGPVRSSRRRASVMRLPASRPQSITRTGGGGDGPVLAREREVGLPHARVGAEEGVVLAGRRKRVAQAAVKGRTRDGALAEVRCRGVREVRRGRCWRARSRRRARGGERGAGAGAAVEASVVIPCVFADIFRCLARTGTQRA
jgi:hypothetical protein